jgi:hypothetical protein
MVYAALLAKALLEKAFHRDYAHRGLNSPSGGFFPLASPRVSLFFSRGKSRSSAQRAERAGRKTVTQKRRYPIRKYLLVYISNVISGRALPRDITGA